MWGRAPPIRVFSSLWWFVAVFLKGDSGDLQVGPRGWLGGGPGLAGAAFLAPLPARWLHAQITTSPPRLSYAGHLRLAIVSLFAEGSSRRKLTCCSPQAGSFTPSPHWEWLGPGQEGVGQIVDNTTGSLERSELPGREKCKQKGHSLADLLGPITGQAVHKGTGDTDMRQRSF